MHERASIRPFFLMIVLLGTVVTIHSEGQKESERPNAIGQSLRSLDFGNPLGLTKGMSPDDVRRIFPDVEYDTNGFLQSPLSEAYAPFTSILIQMDRNHRVYLLELTSDMQTVEPESDALDRTFETLSELIASKHGPLVLEGFDNAMEIPGLARILDRNAALVQGWTIDGKHVNVLLVEERAGDRSGYFNLYMWLS